MAEFEAAAARASECMAAVASWITPGRQTVNPLAVDVPMLPLVGELYLVDTLLLRSGDRTRRPLVVVDVPRDHFGVIAVVTRTTKLQAAGVFHRADLRLRLIRDGVFTRPVAVEAADWRPRMVHRLGVLDAATFGQVLDWVG